MRLWLHIGPDAVLAERLQQVLAAKRKPLAEAGVLVPRSPGGSNHTRLFMAVTAPDQPDALRVGRGFETASAQAVLRAELVASLQAEIAQANPEMTILSAHQLGSSLQSRAEISRLAELLRPLSDDIRIVAHVDSPDRMLLRRYTAQVLDGRVRPLALELAMCDQASWWDAAMTATPPSQPAAGVFSEAQAPAHFLDLARLVAEWDAVFGTGATQLHSVNTALWSSGRIVKDLRQCFDISARVGQAEAWTLPAMPPAAWITRCRLMNDALLRLMRQRQQTLPKMLWRKLLHEVFIDGPADTAGRLSPIAARFAPDLEALCAAHTGLDPKDMAPPPPAALWQDTNPRFGYRATQYLTAFLPRIDSAMKQAASAQKLADLAPEEIDKALSPAARDQMPELAKQKFLSLRGSPFAPHNKLGQVNDEAQLPAFDPAPPRVLPDGSTGTVVVACMKNEAPYILEWIAYHRAIGVDSFVIYTNGCEDQTDPILLRLQAMGLVHHRSNEGWTGTSPQNYALGQAMKDPVVRAAEWIAHIDVDEFINVRCGNGTLQDFLSRVPDATNVAMTWRLFGHGGVTQYEDRFVLGQFDACAPRFCPKPHTAWGFKSLTRNIGAYGKLSCHRPNNPRNTEGVKWVNGNGQDITQDTHTSGWRSTKRTIGYDLLQLNHYALRSAESFLVKRQRGRALHVDRTIGLNYWIRMDWSGARDISIQRNIPRLKAEYTRLLSDPELAALHSAAVDWHRQKAASLRQIPEFEDLYQRAVALSLTPLERVAFALALDVES